MSKSVGQQDGFYRLPEKVPSRVKKDGVLVLVGAIDAGGVLHTARNSVIDRFDDTKIALEKWVKSGSFNKIIVFDSSGYNINNLEEICKSSDIEFELISKNLQDFDRSLGKGYGTYLSVEYLMGHSELFNNAEIIAIVSARYYIKNAKKIIDGYGTDIQANLNLNLSFAFNPLFIAPRSFFEKYWLEFMSLTNDIERTSYEHCLAKAIHRAISDGYTWELPVESPNIDAVSGTTNKKYYRGYVHWLGLKYYSYLKRFVFEFKR